MRPPRADPAERSGYLRFFYPGLAPDPLGEDLERGLRVGVRAWPDT